MKNLQKEYKHLKPLKEENDFFKLGAQNLKRELRKNFPNIKFSVQCDYGTSYIVRYEDGVSIEEIENFSNKFVIGRFDGSIDYAYNEKSEFNKIFGGVEYLWINRSFSKDMIERKIKEVQIDYPNMSADYKSIFKNSNQLVEKDQNFNNYYLSLETIAEYRLINNF